MNRERARALAERLEEARMLGGVWPELETALIDAATFLRSVAEQEGIDAILGEALCKALGKECPLPNFSEHEKIGAAQVAALSAAGFVVRPREPTPEMIVAGQDEHDNCVDHGQDSNSDGERFDYTHISPDAPRRVFIAMVDGYKPAPTAIRDKDNE